MKHLSLAAALALAFGTLLPASRADAADPIRVSKSEATTFAFAFIEVGAQEGIYAKHGIEVETLNLGGAAKAHQALLAGSADIELGSGLELMFVAKGSPTKGVAVLAGPPLGFAIMVAKDGGINSVADLKGKLIGVSTVGSLSDWLPTEISRRQGWGSEGIKRVALGSQDGLTGALISHNVDGIIGGTQTGYRLEQAGSGRILTTFGPLIPDFIVHMIVASDSLIAAHPDMLKRFLAGWFETVHFAKTHKDETVRDTMQLTRLPPDLAARLYDEQIAMFSDDGRFQPKALAVTKEAVKQLGDLDKLPPDNQLYTEAFLPAAAPAH
jgi:ABC-type nitrate/sulfonate/bicarbonate transport system substrate-binding protein